MCRGLVFAGQIGGGVGVGAAVIICFLVPSVLPLQITQFRLAIGLLGFLRSKSRFQTVDC